MTGVVLDAVRKIINSFDDVDTTASVVREALQLVSNQKQVILHVHPEQVTEVREKVSSILSDFPEVGYVEVIADARLKTAAAYWRPRSVLSMRVSTVNCKRSSKLLPSN